MPLRRASSSRNWAKPDGSCGSIKFGGVASFLLAARALAFKKPSAHADGMGLPSLSGLRKWPSIGLSTWASSQYFTYQVMSADGPGDPSYSFSAATLLAMAFFALLVCEIDLLPSRRHCGGSARLL